jgi:hypothetical protein
MVNSVTSLFIFSFKKNGGQEAIQCKTYIVYFKNWLLQNFCGGGQTGKGVRFRLWSLGVRVPPPAPVII